MCGWDTCLYYVYVILCIHVSILNVNIYVCACAHIFTHIYLHVCENTQISMQIHTCTLCTCMNMCVYICVYIQGCACICDHMQTFDMCSIAVCSFIYVACIYFAMLRS